MQTQEQRRVALAAEALAAVVTPPIQPGNAADRQTVREN
jgi:hypothetical protein